MIGGLQRAIGRSWWLCPVSALTNRTESQCICLGVEREDSALFISWGFHWTFSTAELLKQSAFPSGSQNGHCFHRCCCCYQPLCTACFLQGRGWAHVRSHVLTQPFGADTTNLPPLLSNWGSEKVHAPAARSHQNPMQPDRIKVWIAITSLFRSGWRTQKEVAQMLWKPLTLLSIRKQQEGILPREPAPFLDRSLGGVAPTYNQSTFLGRTQLKSSVEHSACVDPDQRKVLEKHMLVYDNQETWLTSERSPESLILFPIQVSSKP